MTPEQRRAKYPLPPVTPMDESELAELGRKAEQWLSRPAMTALSLDRHYFTIARLLATIKAIRPEAPDDHP